MSMQVYKISTAYDEDGNSPWDAIWYDGDDEDLDVLGCPMRLGAIWSSPQTRLEKRNKTPDIYAFQLYYAVSERVKAQLLPIVEDTAEFLPLSTDSAEPLFVLHPLLRLDLDERAVVLKNSVSGNITVIKKYSFDPHDFEERIPIFQVRQGLGSVARSAGFPCTGVLVCRDVFKVHQKNRFRGVTIDKVF